MIEISDYILTESKKGETRMIHLETLVEVMKISIGLGTGMCFIVLSDEMVLERQYPWSSGHI